MSELQAYFTGVGRRKSATASIKLVNGSGVMKVNGREIVEYFTAIGSEVVYMRPFAVLSTTGSFDVEAKVSGGGVEGQLEAFALGAANALLKVNPEFRKQLKPFGLLTRDSRMKESRKYGRAGKARKMRSSPKR